MGIMDSIKKAKENAENRRLIADYVYEAERIVKEGQTIYEDAFYKTRGKASDLKYRVSKFVEFKKNTLAEMNALLKKAGASEIEISAAQLDVNIDYFNDSPEVYVESDFYGGSAFSELSLILESIRPMSIRDFTGDTRSELYEARAQRSEAKVFKERMRAEKARLNNIISAMNEVHSFINDEESQIEKMMRTLKSTIDSSNTDSSDKKNALTKIANLIAQTLTTQFIDSNFVVTSQYQSLHNQLRTINSSAGSSGTPEIYWKSISTMLK